LIPINPRLPGVFAEWGRQNVYAVADDFCRTGRVYREPISDLDAITCQLPSDISSNGTQNAAIPDKCQIELVASSRRGATWTSP
jgi:hypothetical protein